MTSIDYVLGKTIYDPVDHVLIIMGDTFDKTPLIINLNQTDLECMCKIILSNHKGVKLKQRPITQDEISYKKSYNHIYHRQRYSKKLAGFS